MYFEQNQAGWAMLPELLAGCLCNKHQRDAGGHHWVGASGCLLGVGREAGGWEEAPLCTYITELALHFSLGSQNNPV